MKTPTLFKTPGKTMRISAHFLTGTSLNRFEAQSLVDHCFNSTISALASCHRLTLQRTAEKVANRCRVVHYSLSDVDLTCANAILATLIRNARPSRED